MLLQLPDPPGSRENGRKTMRDQMDSEIWNAHHDQFSEWLDGALGRARSALRGGGSLAARVPGQLLAALVAVSLTVVTFGASGV